MQKSAKGFTLIELLVVISITAIIGVYTLSNYRSFGEDQNLKNSALDVVSLLRTAQTNAMANLICLSNYGAYQQVQFSNPKNILLTCQLPGSGATLKKLTLDPKIPNISIQSISWIGPGCPPGTSGLNFLSVSGKIEVPAIGGENCTSVVIVLVNNKTGNTKSVIVEMGGRIYAP